MSSRNRAHTAQARERLAQQTERAPPLPPALEALEATAQRAVAPHGNACKARASRLASKSSRQSSRPFPFILCECVVVFVLFWKPLYRVRVIHSSWLDLTVPPSIDNRLVCVSPCGAFSSFYTTNVHTRGRVGKSSRGACAAGRTKTSNSGSSWCSHNPTLTNPFRERASERAWLARHRLACGM